MRGVVAVDESGWYRPGIRNWEWNRPADVHKTMFEPYAKFRDKDKAISAANNMLGEALAKHHDEFEMMQTDAHLHKRMQTAARKYGFELHVADAEPKKLTR